MHQELIKRLTDSGIKKAKIESDLGMPKNSLSGMLSGSKEIPVKWVQPLTNYANKLNKDYGGEKGVIKQSTEVMNELVNNIKLKEPDEPRTKLVVEKTGLKEKPSDGISAKLKALTDKLNKDFGAGTFMRMGDKPNTGYDIVPTGSIGLNKALGIGGLPRGRIVEIYGPESAGKTTITLHVISEAQKKGLKCGIIDAENSFDPEYATALGINVDDLFVCQPSCGEEGLEVADQAIQSGEFGVIIIDSVAALIPKSELEGAMGDSKMGLHARLMSQACRKMTGSIAKTNTLCVFINQLRNKIGVIYGSPEVTTGGMALQFYASVRLDVRKSTKILDGEVSLGNKTRVKVVKNKCASPFKTAEFDIIYGEGINKTGEIIDAAVTQNIIQKSGSWYSYNGSKLGQGSAQVQELLESNPELLTEIEKKI